MDKTLTLVILLCTGVVVGAVLVAIVLGVAANNLGRRFLDWGTPKELRK